MKARIFQLRKAVLGMGKSAIVLEGGSLRCMFSAGVTDVMMEQGIEYDGLFGVSAGALTGVNFVSRQIGRTAKINLDFVNDKRYLGVRNLIFHKSIFNFDFLFNEVSDTLLPLDRKAFHQSPCRYTAVSTSCLTGKTVYSEKETSSDIYAAIRASASMPLLSPMVLVEGVPCLDGGISVAIPYQKAIEEGYDKIVVVTTREHGFRKPQVSRPMARMYARYYGKYPNLVRCLVDVPRMYAKELDEIDRLEAQGKLFVIRPPKPVTVSHTEKDTKKLQALYEEGQATCRRQLEELIAYLET